MVNKKFIILLGCLLFAKSGVAGECDEYKKSPEITLKKAEQNIVIKKSDKDLWPVGGFVNIQPFNSVSPKIGYVFNGKFYCVYLDSVDATVGFRDFEITVDKKYKKDSCEYNAVLEHENHHITDAKNAFEKVFPKVEKILTDVANSLEPIYVESAEGVPYAMEKISDNIVKNKKLKNLVQEFQKQQESDAKKLDEKPDEKLQKCEQDKLDAAFEKYYKEKTK